MIGMKELSLKINLHPNTIRRYIKKGLPKKQLDRKYLFDYDEVLKWITERKK